jgi:hypothetical protein
MFPKNSVSPVYRVLVEVAMANMSSVFSAAKMTISLQTSILPSSGAFFQYCNYFNLSACDALDGAPLGLTPLKRGFYREIIYPKVFSKASQHSR